MSVNRVVGHIILVFGLLVYLSEASAQDAVFLSDSTDVFMPADTTTIGDSISTLIMSADEAIHIVDDIGETDTLIGNVVLIQDSIYMNCDYAVVQNQINAIANGNIRIVHNDSLVIYADTLYYNGLTRMARLTGEVILMNNDKYLNTTDLIYNISEEKARFDKGGTLIDRESKLISREGTYDARRDEALFRYNVRYTDTLRTILTDSLLYDYAASLIHIISPTNILQDENEIYSRAGLFNTATNEGVLSEDVQILLEDRTISAGVLNYEGDSSIYRLYINPVVRDDEGGVARGDTIFYDKHESLVTLIGDASYQSKAQNINADIIYYDQENNTYRTEGRSSASDESTDIIADRISKSKEGSTIAEGAVILTDTAAHYQIICDRVELIDSIDRAVAYSLNGPALLRYELGRDDTLQLLADTLVSYKLDSVSLFEAYYDVQIMSDGVSGVCDSLLYNMTDSVILLYQYPILWSDSTQLRGDTIMMSLKEEGINKIELIDNASIISMDTDGYFNQVGGSQIDCFFDDGEMRSADVDGNTELIYFMRDDADELQGINTTFSGTMRFQFADSEIDQVRFFRNPDSTIHEYSAGIDVNSFRIQNFVWNIEKRPLESQFLFKPKLINNAEQ